MNETIIRRVPQAGAPWLIQCDFDGTISLDDVTDTLLAQHGRPGWQDLEAAWERGEIGSLQCMQGQIALLDMTLDQLHARLDEISLDPGFARFAALARRYGVEIQVVSDGLDYAIEHLLAREGLTGLPVLANHLQPAGPATWRLQTPWSRPACVSAHCKCGQLARAHAGGHRVLYIGDGSSDFCVSGQADFVLAKSRLRTYCREQGIAHASFDDFGQATALLPWLLQTLSLEVPA